MDRRFIWAMALMTLIVMAPAVLMKKPPAPVSAPADSVATVAPVPAPAPDLGAAAALPLAVGGQVLGVFTLYAGAPGFFDDEELCLLDGLGVLVDRRRRQDGGGSRSEPPS